MSADRTSPDSEAGRPSVTNDFASSWEPPGDRLASARSSASHSGRPTDVPALSGCDGLLSR